MPADLVSHPKRLRKGEAWRHCPRGPRYLPDCILRAIVALKRPTHKLSGSISTLPPELLHAIFELLAFSDHNTLSSCMRVCRRWHDIARLYFFAIVPSGSHRCGRLSRLLFADPGLAVHVKHVRFTWNSESNSWRQAWQRPFDVQSLASALPALGLANLRYLSIVGYKNFINLSRPRQSPAQWRRSLQRLFFDNCAGVTHILPYLLSLFSVHTLVIRIDTTLTTSQRTIHRSIPLASVVIRDLVLDMANREEDYRFFESILAPGSLRALSITVWSRRDFSMLEHFLPSRAAQDLRSISIGTTLNSYEWGDGRTGFWHDLGAVLAHCTRLECFRIGFDHCDLPSHPLCRRETFEPIIANLAPTLRAFAICIGLLSRWQSWKRFRDSVVSLDVVDRLLSPSGGRFPRLRTAELHILQEVWCPAGLWLDKPVEAQPRPTPLPRLKDAGLLQVHVVRSVKSYGRGRADVYLPLEMQ